MLLKSAFTLFGTFLFALATPSLAQDEAKSISTSFSQSKTTNESPDLNDEKNEDLPDPVAQMPPKEMLPDGLILPGKGGVYSEYTFVADKSRRTLTIWKFNGSKITFIEAHPIDMGKKDGDKFYSGDHRTPEGVYFFQERLTGPELNFQEYGQMALTMDYPNYFDKREKKTGHGIWLHAVPDTKTLIRGSRGCLVVRNSIIPKLSKFVTLKKTPILVYEKVNYIKRQDLIAKRQKLMQLLDAWRTSWSQQDIETYIQFYDENFNALGMNKKQWKKYKEKLNTKYESISVAVNMPIIFAHKNELIIRFLQDYQSDALSDFGEKSLYLAKPDSSDNFKIIGEEWEPTEHSLLAQKKEEAEQKN